MERTLSINDLAQLLKIAPGTVRNRLSHGDAMPPSFRVGRRRLFLSADVEMWLQLMAGNTRSNPKSPRQD